MVFDHFHFDQLALPFNLQGHPGGRTQWANVTHLCSMMVFELVTRQRHFMRTEQHMLILAQMQAVGVAQKVIHKIAGRVFVHFAR